ncbi:cupin domain-containing protein [Maricurvus nonylphenolicus]|uniref:cupin domain-containing protein n=1 Tax=Maricurvus nonylphenolicus TaxID=1008307 RepID=UPI0036F2C0FC
MNKQQIIESLGLEAHIEGGYFRRTFEASHRERIQTARGERFSFTSIYYLLTDDSPIGHWHLNQSDIFHAYHLGNPITYYLLHPSGELEVKVLGPDLQAGQELQFVVPGGVWKASELTQGQYGLISEAVVPGFDFADMQLATESQLIEEYPQYIDIVKRYCR